MSTSPGRQVLNLYIHPDKGPIKLIELDLMEVEVAVHTSRFAASNPEEERIRQVANRIKAKFPGVDPNSNLRGIASILTRLTSFYQFNGVVIRLTGSIDADVSTPSTAVEDIKRLNSEFDRLSKEVPRLTRLLEIEQQAHRAAKEQYVKLDAEYRRVANERSVLYDKMKTTIDNLQEQVRQRDAQLSRVRQDADTIVRENASLQMQLAQLRQRGEDLEKGNADLQAHLTQRENELAQHRQSTSNSKHTEDQLRKTIKDQEDEIKRLQGRLDKLIDASPVGGLDDFSDVMLEP